jgi:hypothetical protein
VERYRSLATTLFTIRVEVIRRAVKDGNTAQYQKKITNDQYILFKHDLGRLAMEYILEYKISAEEQKEIELINAQLRRKFSR